METAAAGARRPPALRLLCPKKSVLSSPFPSLLWLVGSPRFLHPVTVAAALRCLRFLSDDGPFSPDLPHEADEIRGLLVRGFDIVGGLFLGSANFESDAGRALELAGELRERLFGERASHGMVGGCVDASTGDIRFLVSESEGSEVVEGQEVLWGDEPGRSLLEKGCLLRCELQLQLPLYLPSDETMSGIEARFSSLIESAAANLRGPHVSYLVEGPTATFDESHHSVILHGNNLNSVSQLPINPNTNKCSAKIVSCSEFLPTKRHDLSSIRENADAIQITVLSNQSFNISKAASPVPMLKYFPAPAPASLRVIDLKLDILCYSSMDLPVTVAVSELVIPGLADQLSIMKKAIVSELLTQQPQLCPYHLVPPGLLIPLTAIYDTRYGEIEEKQSELRRNLHFRLGLPLDRPLLRTSNALTFGAMERRDRSSSKSGSSLLRDVHKEIPSSGVSGGIMSLIDGSYEYYHYLHDGIDDNGWGCAYRSLQTIMSWYRLQQYSSINVPSHREIQQVLVEIGDKDPSFIGSREWIGAIELSFVLDKLLGASCKIINVRSGDELPEKCRELAIHFETQGTPVMIGGGVLAYTLLGVDYNEASGDCAFLILDPHYTGADDLKKIVNGGWCAWKKSVDSKGRSFFLKDKFYNLLLPQRPNMV
ncbi:probable Ufm1-specific protease [Triticum aestivum]|uniref:probable Ufm1-specific protease n=1 Tax=Triticum aestivum TaxID=4565 RepID=UPI001D03255F|nr:probable Ufm1-specific protease [Triticum aestivum]